MYAAVEEYKVEFGDDDVPSGDEDRVSRAISRASRLVDTYSRAGGLSTPIIDETAIADIKGPVLDIARYYTWSDSPSEELRKRYEDAISFLEKVALGKVKIIADDSFTPSGFSNIQLVRC